MANSQHTPLTQPQRPFTHQVFLYDERGTGQLTWAYAFSEEDAFKAAEVNAGYWYLTITVCPLPRTREIVQYELDTLWNEIRPLKDQWMEMELQADALMRDPDNYSRVLPASDPRWQEGDRLYKQAEPIRNRAGQLRQRWHALYAELRQLEGGR